MDGQIDGLDGWMDGWIYESVARWMDGQIKHGLMILKDWCIDGQKDVTMVGFACAWVDEY